MLFGILGFVIGCFSGAVISILAIALAMQGRDDDEEQKEF